jgi:hypothetical protein
MLIIATASIDSSRFIEILIFVLELRLENQ